MEIPFFNPYEYNYYHYKPCDKYMHVIKKYQDIAQETELLELLSDEKITIFHNLLKYLVSQDIVDLFKKLVESYNIDLSMEDNIFLKISCSNGSINILKYLVFQGTKLDLCDNFAIKAASSLSNIDMLKFILDNDISASINNNYPIQCAAQAGSLAAIKLLVQYDADIHSKNEYVLRNAVYNENYQIVEYAINMDANINVNNGFPIRTAINNMDTKCTKLLLQKGADINFITENDLIKVIRCGIEPHINLLADHGVNFNMLNNCVCEQKANNYINTLISKGIDVTKLATIMYIYDNVYNNDEDTHIYY